jgi:hypothetical protein
MLIAVVAGQPVIVTSNLTDVGLNVTVAVPEQLASASVIGGTSFADFNSALNVLAGVGEGDGDGDAVFVGDGLGDGLGAAAVPPQAAIRIAAAAMPAKRRMLGPPSLLGALLYTASVAGRMRRRYRAGL